MYILAGKSVSPVYFPHITYTYFSELQHLFVRTLVRRYTLCLFSPLKRHNWFLAWSPRERDINKTRGGATCDIPPTPTPSPAFLCIFPCVFHARRGVFSCACAVLRAVLCYNVLCSCAFACLCPFCVKLGGVVAWLLLSVCVSLCAVVAVAVVCFLSLLFWVGLCFVGLFVSLSFSFAFVMLWRCIVRLFYGEFYQFPSFAIIKKTPSVLLVGVCISSWGFTMLSVMCCC